MNCFLLFKNFVKTHFAALNEDGRPFSKTPQHDRLNCKLYLQLIPLKTVYNFRRSKLFNICVIWQENVQPFGKKLQQRRKSCIPRARRSFLRKKFSEKKSLLYFYGFRAERKGLLDEHPLTGLLKLYITSPEKQAKQSTFCKFGFCKISRRLRQDFWPFSIYVPTSLTEMHSTCLEKHFDE